MSYSRTQERGTQKSAKQSLLIVMLMALVSLFAVGCGDSGEDFVVTGNQGNNGANTGAVTFQFARAQQAVPATTALLDFRFFSANGLQVFERLNEPFNTTVTVQNVPTSATRAVVTAKNAAGIPLATIDYSVNVVGGGTSAAVAGTSTPVTFDTVTATPDPTSVAVGATQQLSLAVGFSNGDSFTGTAAGGTPVFTSSAPGTASVNATGLVTGVAAGPATITVAYALNGVTRTDTVTVTVTAPATGAARLELAPATVNLTNAAPSATIVATFFPANSTTGQNVTAQTTAAPRAGVTYAAGTFTSTAIENSTGNVTVSFTSGATTVNNTVAVNVNRLAAGQVPTPPTPPGTPARLDVQPDSLVLAPGGFSGAISARFFPVNSTTGTLVPTANLTVTFGGSNPPATQDRYQYTAATGVIQAQGPFPSFLNPAEGSTVVATVSSVQGGVTVTDTINISINAAQAGLVTSARIVSVVGTSLRLTQNSAYPIVIEETLFSGATQIVAFGNVRNGVAANPGQYSVTSSNPAAATYADQQANRLMTFPAIGQATVTFTRNNAAPALGAAVSLPVTVNTVNVTDLVDAPANQLALVVNPQSGRVNDALAWRTELRYKNNLVQDVTPVVGVFSSIGTTPTFGGFAPAAGGAYRGFVLLPAAPAAGTLAIVRANDTFGLVTNGITTQDLLPVAISATP